MVFISWFVLLAILLSATNQYVWKEKNSKAMELYSQAEALKKKKIARKLRKRAKDIRKKHNLQEPVK